MGILQLPSELLILIADDLEVLDISSSCRCCRGLYAILDPILYCRLRNDINVLRWATERGDIHIVRKLLESGANPDRNIVPPKSTNSLDAPLFHHGGPLADRDTHVIREQLAKQWQRVNFPLSDTWTPLHLAVRLAYDDIVELLLDHGANINALSRGCCPCKRYFESTTERPWWTPLHIAICRRNEKMVRLLASRGASFQVAARALGSSSNYVSALHVSSHTGALSISDFLVGHYRPQIDIQDHNGMSPLSWACRGNQWNMVEWLIKNGANVDANAGNYRSLLLDACACRRLSEAHRLLDLGANPNYFFRSAPLHHCCERYSDHQLGSTEPYDMLELVKHLVKAGADINAEDEEGWATPLAIAASGDSCYLVEYLLEAGADVKAKDKYHVTPLGRACSHKHIYPLVDLLLDRGASTTDVDGGRRSPLEILCHAGLEGRDKRAIMELLLAHGSPINATSDPNKSLIHAAFMKNDLEICEYLHRLQSRPPSRTELTAMITHAVLNDDPKALLFALKFKDATEILCTRTRLFKALEKQCNDVVDIIFNAGAPWTHVSKTGWTCLLYACKSDNATFARKLLDVGADPNHFNCVGETALDWAVTNGNVHMCKTLLDYGADPFLSETPHGVPHMGAFRRAIAFSKVDIVEQITRPGLFRAASADVQDQAMYDVCTRDPGPATTTLLAALLRGGADPNRALADRYTSGFCSPLQIVQEHHNQEAVDLLLSYGTSPATDTADTEVFDMFNVY